jgi:hypothetical protein
MRCYPHGPLPHHCGYFVFHTHAKNNAPSMIQMIVDVLIAYIYILYNI